MWPALIAAGAQVAGGLISGHGQGQANAANAAQVQKQNQFNAEQAQLNRDFQERMSGTQYQRAVADMRAAGLNPGLAYQQGGAGTPTGSTASGAPPARRENTAAPLGQAVTQSTQGAIDAYTTLQQSKAIAANQSAQAYRNAMEGSLAALDQSRLSDNDIQQTLKETMKAQLRLIQTNAMEGSARTGFLQSQTRLNSQQYTPATYNKYFAPWNNTAKDVLETISKLTKTFGPLMP